ncbi:MAG TPA: AAA family ATPase [Sedimentisphaerales bacterium]|nr:AAA family ATPase [Sedimentisphaerales bacterium]
MTDTPKNFVIGLTGSLGSGCSTLSRALESKGFKRISLSDPIKDKFRELNPGKEPTKDSFGEDWRAELQDIGNKGRQGEYIESSVESNGSNHYDYWIDLALKSVNGSDCDIVIDGIRNSGEVESLRERYPQSHFWLVAVYADYETRWERIRERYPSEKVFKRDDLRDSNEDERFGQNVQKCVYEADFVFKNEKPLQPNSKIIETLAERLMRQVSVMKGEDFRNPTIREVSMATAVSQSNASRCLKRKVGALIVDENNIPLSVGYNDNPVRMESCLTLYNGQCYKDMIMESKLEEMGPLFCPKCSKEHESLSKTWICDGTVKTGEDEKPCRYNFKLKFFPSRNMELCTAIHAEERAIRSLGGRSAEGCTLYVNTFPCFQCSRYIKDADIKKVVYVEAYPIKEAVDFLKTNSIIIEAFEGFKPRVFNQVFKQIE